MKLTRKKEKVLEESINLIPMINIIFLLLIFFLLTGVVQKKNKLDIIVPESSHGEKSTLNDNKPIIISINYEGSYFLNDERVSIENFDRQILSKKSYIIINIDQKTKINELNKFFNLLKNNEVEKVHLNVRKKSDDKN